MAANTEFSQQGAASTAELSKAELLFRRIRRPQTYWRLGNEVVDRALGWHLVNRQVVARAELQGSNFFVVQVGAYDGQRADPINRYIKRYDWNGLLVEPIPRYYEALRRTYASQAGLEFAQLAISDRDGNATLYAVNPNNSQPSMLSGSSSLNRSVIDTSAWTVRDAESIIDPITVRTQRLAGLLGTYSVGHIDYLVVDTEGHDGVVVNQALELPAEQIPPMILYEHMHLPRTERQGLEANLHDAGFSLWHLRRDTFAWQPLDTAPNQ